MPGKVRRAPLESRTARSRLKRGRQPHWQAITGKAHLGWQCWKGDSEGRWVLRQRTAPDKYTIEAIGIADDRDQADGVHVLSYEQADAKARAAVCAPKAKVAGLTVREAMRRYIAHQHLLGKSARDAETRIAAHVLPDLGDLVVAELTAERLRQWLADMANTPAQHRPKGGKPQYRAAPVTEDGMRARRNTANRVLTILKAALNFACKEGLVTSREEWGRNKLEPLKRAAAARVRFLSVAEGQRLINAADADFRPLAIAALQTGARYGELARLEVQDFNPDAGTVAVRMSKSDKPRQIILTEEGVAFFRSHCAGRPGSALMFTRDGKPWLKSNQGPPMREASQRAGIIPPINFHALRHTWASLAVMNHVPLMVVARNLGHTDTKMVERHYGHMEQSYIVDAIRAGAPRFGIEPYPKVVPLKA